MKITKSQLKGLIRETIKEQLGEDLYEDTEADERRIVSYYELWSPEDIEHGETFDKGELHDESMEPDEIDREDELTAVDLAEKYLTQADAVEPSSSHFHPGIWYTTYGEEDFRTGERQNESYHLKGFSKREEAEVFERMK